MEKGMERPSPAAGGQGEPRARVRYRIVESGFAGCRGILGSDGRDSVIVALPGGGRERGEALAARLEQEQVPIAEAGERILLEGEEPFLR